MNYAKIQIKGRAGRMGELKYTQSGKPIFQVSIAVSKGTKETQKTTWFRVKAFGTLAESLVINKGDLVLVEGNFELASWIDKKTGNQVQAPEILANSCSVEFSKNAFEPTQKQNQPMQEDYPF